MELADFENYSGDINLEYGGLFVDLPDWRYGYADALRITDLDSACGFDGACLVEHITVYFGDSKRVKDAFRCCDHERMRGMDTHGRKMWIVDAMVWYGLYDPVSDMMGPNAIIVQTDPDGPIVFDGWEDGYEIVKLDDDQDLFGYLLDNSWLADFE